MSALALQLAVRDHLRETLHYSQNQCEITFDGQPLPIASNYFVAVHQGEWRGNGDQVEGLDEYYGIDLTATVWAGKYPLDRFVNLLVAVGKSLDRILEDLRATMHKDKGAYPVLTRANQILGTGTRNGFVEPLIFANGGRPMEKGPDWFYAAHPQTQSTPPPMGIAQTMSFTGARRVQVIENQE